MIGRGRSFSGSRLGRSNQANQWLWSYTCCNLLKLLMAATICTFLKAIYRRCLIWTYLTSRLTISSSSTLAQFCQFQTFVTRKTTIAVRIARQMFWLKKRGPHLSSISMAWREIPRPGCKFNIGLTKWTDLKCCTRGVLSWKAMSVWWRSSCRPSKWKKARFSLLSHMSRMERVILGSK